MAQTLMITLTINPGLKQAETLLWAQALHLTPALPASPQLRPRQLGTLDASPQRSEFSCRCSSTGSASHSSRRRHRHSPGDSFEAGSVFVCSFGPSDTPWPNPSALFYNIPDPSLEL